jgi:hypothetical protein
MNAIRIRKQIESDTLRLPELQGLIGRTVEIIILDETPPPVGPQETQETFFARLPPEPLATPTQRQAEMQQLHEMAKSDPKLAAFLAAAGADCLDVDAIIACRE